MNTQQTSTDLARQIDRARGRTLDSILRALTVAAALLVFGLFAPTAFADHMGNHLRPRDNSDGVDSTAVSNIACGQKSESGTQWLIGAAAEYGPRRNVGDDAACANSQALPADAEPGAPGISFVVLSGLDPAAAGGQGLEMREYTWEPGSYVTAHTHPAAFLVCVQSGAIGFSIQSGAAVVTRAGDSAATPPAAEPMAVGDEVVLEPRDCVAADNAADRTIHTAWNASDETSITIETYL